MFNLSIARIQFITADNTHIKYLNGKDKKAWNNYKEALEAQDQLENFFGSLPNVGAGEELEIEANKE